MPNWCENTLEIYGDEDKMKEFYDFFGGRDKLQENFCFNNILTLPQELDGTRSPSNIVSQEDYDRYTQLEKKHNIKDTQDVNRLVEDGTITEEERDLLWKEGITQEMSDMRKSEYGYDNWYDWRNNNWGTKWDINTEVHVDDLHDEGCTLIFQTAWSPPEPIVVKLQEMFPDLTFYGGYIGEGWEFAGVFQ
tara:strand:+ start:326 stop:898 length:573 start_codon:yes stop_codon:yes gene_type:complete